MKNETFRVISILICFFVIVSCSHENQFTQKKYDKLQKIAVNSDGTNYCNSNKLPKKPEHVIIAETENYVSEKTSDLLSYAPENKTGISTPYEESLIPFILKKATKKLLVSNFPDVKKQNYTQRTVKTSDNKAVPRETGWQIFLRIAIIVVVIVGIVIAAYFIAKSN